MDNIMDNHQRTQTRVALHGVITFLLGLLSAIGFSYAAAVASTESQMYGVWRFAHMEGLLNGLMLLAVAGIYPLMATASKAFHGAVCLAIVGAYCNSVGPILTALFVGHRIIEPNGLLESIIVYGFYIPGTLPLISFFIFAHYLWMRAAALK